MRTPSNRDASGRSFFDQPEHGWPSRRIIWSCTASRGPLLTRYFLLQTRWLGVYLHHLHASDDDRAMHDHPWTFVSLLLSRRLLGARAVPLRLLLRESEYRRDRSDLVSPILDTRTSGRVAPSSRTRGAVLDARLEVSASETLGLLDDRRLARLANIREGVV